MKKISICITNHNRFDLLKKSYEQVVNDDRVGEVVIVDDCSSPEISKQVDSLATEKVKVYHNTVNLGVYRNKHRSVQLAAFDWVIVGDSDNIFGVDYIDKLYELEWDKNTEYCPARANPAFKFDALTGITIDKSNVNAYWHTTHFQSFINAMNSFFNRDEYLRVWKGDIEPISADSIYMNYLWLAAGNKLKVVSGLEYSHLIHTGSHYVNNCARSNVLYNQIVQKFKRLR